MKPMVQTETIQLISQEPKIELFTINQHYHGKDHVRYLVRKWGTGGRWNHEDHPHRTLSAAMKNAKRGLTPR